MAEKLSKTEKKQKFLKLAMKRLKRCIAADEHNRKRGRDCAKFVYLPENQWTPSQRTQRSGSGRPILTINILTQFLDQVTGDARHIEPRAKVIPVGDGADVGIASIYQGILSNTHYLSNAQTIHSQALEQMVATGYGAWRVKTRYCEENPFLQEIYFEAVPNAMTVYLEPGKDIVYADARYGFIYTKMAKEDFEEEYPDIDVSTYDGAQWGTGTGFEMFYESDSVAVIEYFVMESEKVMMVQLEDGTVMPEEAALELIKEWEKQNQKTIDALTTASILKADALAAGPLPGATPTGQQAPPTSTQATAPPPGGAPMQGTNPLAQTGGRPPQGQPLPPQSGGTPPTSQRPNSPVPQSPAGAPKPVIKQKRETDRTVIKQYIITPDDVLNEHGLDGEPIPGKFIPIVLVKGREVNVEGKTHVFPMIWNAMDAQKLYNYWNTAAAETIALAPKAPFMATATQIQGYESAWENANTDNNSVLIYNPDPEAPGPPARVQSANPPVSIFNQIDRAAQDIKRCLGMYSSDLGEATPERSGIAVTNKQRPGDISTYVYVSNLMRGIKHADRIAASMIPEIYDSMRDVRLRNHDGTETVAPVNIPIDDLLKRIRQDPDKYPELARDAKRLMKFALGPSSKALFNDMSVGKYSVEIVEGPSYATQRQEAAQEIMKLMQLLPAKAPLMGDLVARNMDFKGAEAIADRLARTLPQGMIPQQPGKPALEPLPPPPQALMAAKKMQIDDAKVAVQKMKAEAEIMKAQTERIKAEIARIQAMKELGDTDNNVRKAVLDVLAELHSPQHPADQTLLAQLAAERQPMAQPDLTNNQDFSEMS